MQPEAISNEADRTNHQQGFDDGEIFSVDGELARVCKGISHRTLVRASHDLRKQGTLRCLGRGPDAQWEKLGR